MFHLAALFLIMGLGSHHNFAKGEPEKEDPLENICDRYEEECGEAGHKKFLCKRTFIKTIAKETGLPSKQITKRMRDCGKNHGKGGGTAGAILPMLPVASMVAKPIITKGLESFRNTDTSPSETPPQPPTDVKKSEEQGKKTASEASTETKKSTPSKGAELWKIPREKMREPKGKKEANGTTGATGTPGAKPGSSSASPPLNTKSASPKMAAVIPALKPPGKGKK